MCNPPAPREFAHERQQWYGDEGKSAYCRYIRHLHEISKDWNALMAVVAKFECDEGHSFQRIVTASPRWYVRFGTQCFMADFTYGDLRSEAIALARCIMAVVAQEK